jgi:hypothetical protein
MISREALAVPLEAKRAYKSSLCWSLDLPTRDRYRVVEWIPVPAALIFDMARNWP